MPFTKRKSCLLLKGIYMYKEKGNKKERKGKKKSLQRDIKNDYHKGLLQRNITRDQ